MTLTDYLKEEKITIKDFANKLRYSRGYMSTVVNGKYKPSKKVVDDVFRATKGKVKLEQGI